MFIQAALRATFVWSFCFVKCRVLVLMSSWLVDNYVTRKARGKSRVLVNSRPLIEKRHKSAKSIIPSCFGHVPWCLVQNTVIAIRCEDTCLAGSLLLNIPGLSLSKRKHNDITTKTQSEDEILPLPCQEGRTANCHTRLTSANWMAFKEDKFINKNREKSYKKDKYIFLKFLEEKPILEVKIHQDPKR